MISHLQLEFLNPDALTPAIIEAGGAIPFDHQLTASSDIDYDDQIGRFTIKTAGTWLVNWFVAPQTGLSSQGSNFGIAVYEPIEDIDDPEYPGLMEPQIIVGSGHVKISATSGFTVIEVSDVQAEFGGVVFDLQNTSDQDTALSERTQVKAGLAIFGSVNDAPNAMAYGQWQASGWDKIENPYNLDNNEAIKFNTPILPPLGIVAEDSEEGAGRIGDDVFILEQSGIYQVSWEIPIEATNTVEAVELVLQLNGTTIYSKSYAPLPIGVVSGTAIVAAKTNNARISFLNTQPGDGDIIQIGNYSNLAIHQISKTEPEQN